MIQNKKTPPGFPEGVPPPHYIHVFALLHAIFISELVVNRLHEIGNVAAVCKFFKDLHNFRPGLQDYLR